MNFFQGDVLDKNFIHQHCHDADIAHHLAGITDVPRVKSESNKKHDKKIKLVGEKGKQNILDVINNKRKIILPSGHVIYEGLSKIQKNNSNISNIFINIKNLEKN